MTLGSRIREERQRLGLTQTQFAALAGASRRAMANWESDGAAPLATALIQWGEAGADTAYILSGIRQTRAVINDLTMIEEHIDQIKKDICEPGRKRRPDETEFQVEERIAQSARIFLGSIVEFANNPFPPYIVNKALDILDLIDNPEKLSIERAGSFIERRKQREASKDLLSVWFKNLPYIPREHVMKILAEIATDYSVPHRMLIELTQEIYTDLQRRAD